jgi:hypothetical protein
MRKSSLRAEASNFGSRALFEEARISQRKRALLKEAQRVH